MFSILGKTSLAARLAELSGLHHVNVGDLIRDHEDDLSEGYDDELQCHIVNEDKLCDELETLVAQGGQIVDYHTASFFPTRWFQQVIVLRASTEVLYSRLRERGYSGDKLDHNMEAEIMQVCLDEARDGWDEKQIMQMINDTVEQQEDNCQQCLSFIEAYRKRYAETHNASGMQI